MELGPQAVMKVADQDVLYVARLANLELSEDERRRMVRDLNSILHYVDRLNELDTSLVEPMTKVAQPIAMTENNGAERMRKDELYGLRPSLPQAKALANAPESDGSFFLVPKVIER
jgi:aspartyl-tRNA(Asn)/glutamyl-tRNA(Gln) amidotransferase subunit C